MNERVGRWGQVRIYTGKFYRIFLHEKGWKFIAFAVIIAVLLSVVMGDRNVCGERIHKNRHVRHCDRHDLGGGI